MTQALQGVEGVVQVEAPGWTSKRAILSAQPGVDETQLISAVKQAGYRASLRQRSTVAPEPLLAPDREFDFDLAVIGTGDAGNGLFIQFTSDPVRDIPIPDEAGSPASSMSFGVLKLAQALGDKAALVDGGRRVIRFHLKDNITGTLNAMTDSVH